MEDKEHSIEQLEEYHRVMATQYEADAKDTTSVFAREYEDWARIRHCGAERQLKSDDHVPA